VTVENIVLLAFHEQTTADEAMRELRRLADEGALSVSTAVNVERALDGRFQVQEDTEKVGLIGTGTGGALAALVGALVGPAGVLLGGRHRRNPRFVLDADDAGRSERVVSEAMRRVPPGTCAVVADVDEAAPEVLDGVVFDLGDWVVRRSRLRAQEELEAAR
jgi:uncharacterized membrane protein